MPKVKVNDHVRDPETFETFLRSDEPYEVDASQAYRLVSENPQSVEEVEDSGAQQAPKPASRSAKGDS